MTHSVRLINGTQFDAEHGPSLLDECLRQGIVLDYSCKTGQCGTCAVRVIAGDTSLLADEVSLTDQQRKQGYVLTCQRTACSDLELEAEDLPELKSFPVKTVPARVDRITQLTNDVVEVVLRTPPSNPLGFMAGQYVSVIGPGGLRRSYSLANAPRVDQKLILHIKRVPGGAMSQYWFEACKPNDLLRIEGPKGTFFLRRQLPATLIMLATGTGYAPIRAILQDLANRLESGDRNAHPKVYVYWGNRNESDFHTEIEWPSGLKGLHHRILSRPEPNWTGRTGYVQNAALSDIPELAGCAAYACGSRSMIEASKIMLLDAGLPSHQFFSDAFVSSE